MGLGTMPRMSFAFPHSRRLHGALAFAGVFESSPQLRAEFLRAIDSRTV